MKNLTGKTVSSTVFWTFPFEIFQFATEYENDVQERVFATGASLNCMVISKELYKEIASMGVKWMHDVSKKEKKNKTIKIQYIMCIGDVQFC